MRILKSREYRIVKNELRIDRFVKLVLINMQVLEMEKEEINDVVDFSVKISNDTEMKRRFTITLESVKNTLKYARAKRLPNEFNRKTVGSTEKV